MKWEWSIGIHVKRFPFLLSIIIIINIWMGINCKEKHKKILVLGYSCENFIIITRTLLSLSLSLTVPCKDIFFTSIENLVNSRLLSLLCRRVEIIKKEGRKTEEKCATYRKQFLSHRNESRFTFLSCHLVAQHEEIRKENCDNLIEFQQRRFADRKFVIIINNLIRLIKFSKIYSKINKFSRFSLKHPWGLFN